MLNSISLSGAKNVSDFPNLDIREFVEGEKYKRLAFVQKVKFGMSVYESGYYTFYVKDVNSNVLAARLFNVRDFVESGATANLYKNKPVVIEFSAQIYNGQWSMVIDKIDLWTGEFDYTKFRGSIEADDVWIRECANRIFGSSDMVSDVYFTDTLSKIADGRCGGIAKLLEMSLHTAESLTGLPEVEVAQVIAVIFYAIEAIYQYEKMQDTLSVVSNTMLLQRINKTKEITAGMELQQYYIDAVVSVYGYGKPQMLYSNLAMQIIDMCRRELDLIYSNLKIPVGATTTVSGMELIRL